MKKITLLLIPALLSISWIASAQTPSPTINGTPPPFTFTGAGVSQAGQTFTFTGGGGAPSGPASGDLSGTYPGPTVAKVNGVAHPASPSVNTVPVVTSATSGGTVTYEAVPNAALANSSTTVNGQTCTLGSTCTVATGLVNITGSSQVTATGCTQSASTGGVCTVSGTSTTTVTFSVIPGTYNNLKIYATTRNTSSASAILAQFNSDAGSNYATQGVNTANTTNTGVMSVSQTNMKIASIPSSTGLAGTSSFTIPFYANTTFVKEGIGLGVDTESISSGTNNIATTLYSTWNSTAAITSVTILVTSGDFANGSIFTLYGEN